MGYGTGEFTSTFVLHNCVVTQKIYISWHMEHRFKKKIQRICRNGSNQCEITEVYIFNLASDVHLQLFKTLFSS